MEKHESRPPSLLRQTREMLHRFGLRARKGLGQHFLIDRGILRKIIGAAEISLSDIVLEIGPGLGVLTKELAQHAGWVIGIELDKQLADILKEDLATLENVAIINADILQITPAALLEEQKASLPPQIASPLKYKVVANLPYYITSPILRHFLEAAVKPQLMVLMVQKEVAQQIVAKPGEMSLLTVSVQFYGEPKIVSYVPAGCFYPPPEVDSAILKIIPYHQPRIAVTDEESFFALVRTGFSMPRKQIANPLAHGLNLPKARVFSLLEKVGIASQRRAESLTLEEWVRLWQVYTQEIAKDVGASRSG